MLSVLSDSRLVQHKLGGSPVHITIDCNENSLKRMASYLSTVRILRVDEAFRLFKEGLVDQIGPGQLGQWIEREADDFGLEDAVLVQRHDHLVRVAQYQVELRVDVKRF